MVSPKITHPKKRIRLLKHHSNHRWGSEFTDSIYLIKREDESFRLYARKHFDGETITLLRVCDILTAEDFARGFRQISEFVENHGIRHVTKKVAFLDRDFAKMIESYLDKDTPNKELMKRAWRVPVESPFPKSR